MDENIPNIYYTRKSERPKMPFDVLFEDAIQADVVDEDFSKLGCP
eukprot:CAMPEP_0201281602 /NCGR_PEP_ID=MMETSP1317-20130820/3461_1 /ASSEMBLY_ACC=CAM_ASM_000770 /TAXON_ID=187299 /ORGANISM="Undescribed Undescribed, Strain Undescribed" /LENGTH=44 /DNA_ID= /DNA_START= /DNA_END= /DNA_ORIENTATION=